jgi:hypothetical protein
MRDVLLRRLFAKPVPVRRPQHGSVLTQHVGFPTRDPISGVTNNNGNFNGN